MERDSETVVGVISLCGYFNSHAHVERDELTLALEYSDSNFNSHAHVERDLAIFSVVDLFVNFNSHAHVERDNIQPCKKSDRTQFQLTRSRGA